MRMAKPQTRRIKGLVTGTPHILELLRSHKAEVPTMIDA